MGSVSQKIHIHTGFKESINANQTWCSGLVGCCTLYNISSESLVEKLIHFYSEIEKKRAVTKKDALYFGQTRDQRTKKGVALQWVSLHNVFKKDCKIPFHKHVLHVYG